MKLVAPASSFAALAYAQRGQGPQGRFGNADIKAMIDNMGAEGDAALALYEQFRGLAGFERFLGSNQAGAQANSFGLSTDGYGCWCYFGAEHVNRKAKGAPLDEYDRACHDLSRGYECAYMEIANCQPWIQQYETIPLGLADITGACNTANLNNDDIPDDEEECAVTTCIIEATFGSTIQDLRLNQNILPNAMYQHDHADWETTTLPDKCKGITGGGRADDCCGVIPKRFPWNSGAPNKKCCTVQATGVETKIYNDAHDQCCADGTVISDGDFCA